MKRKTFPLLFMLLSAVLCLGRTGFDEDTAHAIKGVLRLQESVHDPTSLQISRAVVTNKGVCFEYRSRNESGRMSTGFAVYKTDKDLVWLDNSWLWDQVCLEGKYGQRRNGKDATQAVSAALKEKQGTVLPSQQAINSEAVVSVTVASATVVQPATASARVETVALTVKTPAASVAPAPVAPRKAVRAVPLPKSPSSSGAAAQEAAAMIAPGPVARTPAAQLVVPAAHVETLDNTVPTPAVAPKAAVSGQAAHATPLAVSVVASAPKAETTVASVAPAPAATVPLAPANAVPVPVETGRPAAQASIAAAVAPTSVAAKPGAQPKPAVVAAQPSVVSHAVSSGSVASAELGTIRGVTIVDNNGALERKGPPPAPESLGDAARRLRQSKQQ